MNNINLTGTVSLMEGTAPPDSADLLQASSFLNNGPINTQNLDIQNEAYSTQLFDNPTSIQSVISSHNPSLSASSNIPMHSQFNVGNITQSMSSTNLAEPCYVVSSLSNIHSTSMLSSNNMNDVVLLGNTVNTMSDTLQLTTANRLPQATVNVVNPTQLINKVTQESNGIVNVGSVLTGQSVTSLPRVVTNQQPIGLPIQNITDNKFNSVLLTSVNSGQAVPIQMASPIVQLPQTDLHGLVNSIAEQACLSAAQNVISITKQCNNEGATMSNAMHIQHSLSQGQHFSKKLSNTKHTSPIVHVQKESGSVEFVQLQADNVRQVKPGVFTFSMPKDAKLQSTVVNTNFITTSTNSKKIGKVNSSQQPKSTQGTTSLSNIAAQIIVPALNAQQLAHCQTSKETILQSSKLNTQNDNQAQQNSNENIIVDKISVSHTKSNEENKIIVIEDKDNEGVVEDQNMDCEMFNKETCIESTSGILVDATKGIEVQNINTAISSSKLKTGTELSIPRPDIAKRKRGRPKSIDTVKRNTTDPKNKRKKYKQRKRKEKSLPSIDINLPQHLKRKSTTKPEMIIDLSSDGLEGAVVESGFLLDETIDELIVSKLEKLKAKGWVCSLCNKPGNLPNIGQLFGPYELKITGKEDTSKKATTIMTLPSQSTTRRLKIWLHRDCAIWTHSICLSGRKICGITEALRTSIEYKCCVCKSSGATLCCSDSECAEPYHYMCARQRGCNFQMRSFTIKCPKHK